jgi:hypothetical protein
MSQRPTLMTAADAAFAALMQRFGLRRSADEVTPDWEIAVYQNENAAVRVYKEPREVGPLVQLFELRGGKPPLAWGVDARAADPKNGFDVRDLVNLRAKPQDARAELARLSATTDLSTLLATYAELIDRYASDVLRGDFTVFADLAKITEERRRRAAVNTAR